jgi:hypothetical protein
MSQWWDTYGWAVTRIGPPLLFLLIGIVTATASIRRHFRGRHAPHHCRFSVLVSALPLDNRFVPSSNRWSVFPWRGGE